MKTVSSVVCAVLVACQGAGRAQPAASATPGIVYELGGDLYAVAVDGSRTVRLTTTPVAEHEPAVSPDGRRIAFAVNGSIWTMAADGSHRVRVTSGHDDSSPAWGSGGTRIFFVRLHFVDRAGGPCGSIFRITAAGRVARVTDSRRSGGRSHLDPAVSPDGRRIAYTDWDLCEGGTASPRLRVVDTAGRPTRDLRLLRHNGRYPDPEHSCPAWSPDGRRLAFRKNSDLAVVNRNGSGERRLVSGWRNLIYEPPAWSSDGRWIAFIRSRFGPQQLWIVHPNGSGLRRVGRGSGNYSSPAWLPSMPR